MILQEDCFIYTCAGQGLATAHNGMWQSQSVIIPLDQLFRGILDILQVAAKLAGRIAAFSRKIKDVALLTGQAERPVWQGNAGLAQDMGNQLMTYIGHAGIDMAIEAHPLLTCKCALRSG